MRPLAIVSGISTTTRLIDLLVEKFDVLVWHPEIAGAKQQRYGDKIKTLDSLLKPDHQETILARTLEELPKVLEELPMVQGASSFAFNSVSRQIMLELAFEGLKQKPSVCITHEDVTEFFRKMVLLSSNRGIPTVHIPHNNCYMTDAYGSDIHKETICDWVAGTQHMVDFYKANGYAGNSIAIGTPTQDKWSGHVLTKEDAKRSLKLRPEKPVVTYLTTWAQATNANDDLTIFQKAFFNLVRACDESFQLVLKLSPGEPAEAENMYGRNLAEAGIQAIVVGRTHLERTLAASDLVISAAPSNVLVDAAVLGVPAAHVKIPGFTIGHGVIEIEYSDIGKLIEEFVKSPFKPNYTEFLAHDAHDNVGHAGDEIAQWICKEFA